MSRNARPWTAIAVVIFSAALVAGCASTPAAGSPPVPAAASSPAAVVRTVLAGGDPDFAAGEELQLARYTIQPHTKLAAHHHPGMQLAFIESGTLTYTVIEGSVDVHEADGSIRTIGPGQTGTIATGEWIAENEHVVHFGENATDQPVLILSSSLFTIGDPPAILVSPAPASSPSST